MNLSFLRLRVASDDFINIDAMRFLASTGIIVMHMAYTIVEQPKYLQPMLANFRMFVDLFFIMSGLVIANFYGTAVQDRASYTNFMLRRFARLYPLHLATFLPFFLLWIAASYLHQPLTSPERYDINCIVPNLTMLHAFDLCSHRTFNFASWSISAEMGMYAIFPLLIVALKSVRCVAWAIALLFAVLLAVLDPVWHLRTNNWGVLRALPSFMFGISLFLVRDRLKNMAVPRIAPWLFGLAFVVLALFRVNPFILLMIAFAWVAAAYSCDLRGSTGSIARAIAPLGQLTYSLYMIHPVIMTFGITIFGRMLWKLEGAALNIWVAICACFVLPLLSCVSLFYFETPARRWITNLGTQRRILSTQS